MFTGHIFSQASGDLTNYYLRNGSRNSERKSRRLRTMTRMRKSDGRYSCVNSQAKKNSNFGDSRRDATRYHGLGR